MQEDNKNILKCKAYFNILQIKKCIVSLQGDPSTNSLLCAYHESLRFRCYVVITQFFPQAGGANCLDEKE